MKIDKSDAKMSSIDFPLFTTIMLLTAIGVVMVYSASSYKAFLIKPHKTVCIFKETRLMGTDRNIFYVLYN